MHGPSEKIPKKLFSSLEMGDHNTGGILCVGTLANESLIVALDISLAGDTKAYPSDERTRDNRYL